MKKKIFTAVLSMVLCLGMSVTVMATPSDTSTPSASGTDSNGNKIEVVLDQNGADGTTEAEKKATKAVWDKVTAAQAGGEEAVNNVWKEFVSGVSGMNVTGIDWNASKMIKLTSTVDATTLAKGVNITFSAPGINKGDTVAVLHLKADGTWESISAVAGDGSITGKFTSLSPVWYFKVNLASVEAPAGTPAETPIYSPEWYEAQKALYTDNSAAAGTDAVTSPKTADAAPILPVLAVVCLAGVVVCSRKVKFN